MTEPNMLVMAFYIAAGIFAVIGTLGSVMAVRARLDVRRLLLEAEATRKLSEAAAADEAMLLTGGGHPYRTPDMPSAEEQDPAVELMAALEGKPWTRSRVARDNDNRAPWVHFYHSGKFTLNADNELLLDKTPIGVPEKWVKAMRKRVADEMAGKADGPTRRSILAAAMGEVEERDRKQIPEAVELELEEPS